MPLKQEALYSKSPFVCILIQQLKCRFSAPKCAVPKLLLCPLLQGANIRWPGILELPWLCAAGFCPIPCWWKEKGARSHRSAPLSSLFSHHHMTNITTGSSSAWEFFQAVVRGQQRPFCCRGSCDMFPIFFLSGQSLLSRETPNSVSLENSCY